MLQLLTTLCAAVLEPNLRVNKKFVNLIIREKGEKKFKISKKSRKRENFSI
jgi:hypothetical protein